MAKRIKLSEIGDHLEDQVERLLRVTVLETDKRLKMASPVDTGRFINSWQVGENTSEGQPKPPGTYSSSPPPLQPVNYVAGKEKVGNYYSIHNNLPYAEKLAYAPLGKGSSKRTNGPGWTDLIAKEMEIYVRSQYAKIKRNS